MIRHAHYPCEPIDCSQPCLLIYPRFKFCIRDDRLIYYEQFGFSAGCTKVGKLDISDRVNIQDVCVTRTIWQKNGGAGAPMTQSRRFLRHSRPWAAERTSMPSLPTVPASTSLPSPSKCWAAIRPQNVIRGRFPVKQDLSSPRLLPSSGQTSLLLLCNSEGSTKVSPSLARSQRPSELPVPNR